MRSLETVKRRIKSIATTSKITNAMKLVATSKLKKQKQTYESISVFCSDFYQIIGSIAFSFKNLDFLKVKKSSQEKLWIVITSSIGLCGSYNINVCKKTLMELDKNDKLIIIGKKGLSFFTSKGFSENIISSLEISETDVDFLEMIPLGEQAAQWYQQGKFEAINLVYTKFVNSLTFEPAVLRLFPLSKEIFIDKNDPHFKEILPETRLTEFEPSKESIIKNILPTFISVMIFGSVMESKVSENASRRNAMDIASKNANDLIEKFKLEYNRMRQENITQEINEIVAGANVDE